MELNKVVDISVIIPIYNEQEIIGELYTRLKETVSKISDNHELIFVNDGSTDNSLLELIKLTEKDKNVFYINFSRNFGHQISVTAGLDTCSGNAVIIIDGDLQDPPELILEMYEKHKQGYEVVYAKRAKRKGESILKKVTANLFYRLLKRLTSVDIPVDTGDFRLMDKKIVNYLKQMPEQNKFLRGQISWLGFNQTYVEFNREKRKYGNSGYSYSKMIRFALDGITGFSDKPLIWVSKIGLGVSFISLVIICYAIISHFILDRTITGWTSLIISSAFLGGIQLFSIGIIGEYISRMNKNIQNRPLYIIESSNLVLNK